MDENLTIAVRVQTRSGRSEIVGVTDRRLRIRTRAVPNDGAANKDVALQLAKAFKVPKSGVLLKSGAASRYKTFIILQPRRLPTWLDDLTGGCHE